MENKTCFKCSIEKPLSDFYRHFAMADGHLNKCKSCTKKDVHDHRHGAGREKVLAYDRLRGKEPNRIDAAKAIFVRWKAQNPERRAAQIRLGSAVKGGKIIPWSICAIPECDKRPEAHHPDYSNPLDVVWLCPAHHRQAHALVKATLQTSVV